MKRPSLIQHTVHLALTLILGVSLITAPLATQTAWASNQQESVYKEERDNAKKTENSGQAMTAVHGTVAAVCAAACFGMVTGGSMEGLCTVGSLGAGITEAVMTKNIMSAGISGAMFAYNLSQNGGMTGLMGKFGIGKAAAGATPGGVSAAPNTPPAAPAPAPAAPASAPAPAAANATPANTATNGAKPAESGNKGSKMSCFTGALSAAQAVMSAMSAGKAKKTAEAAQKNMDDLATNSPSMQTGDANQTPLVQTETATSGKILPSFTGGQVGNESGTTTGNGTANGSIHTAGSTDGANGPCGQPATTFQQATTCARATDSRIPASVEDPRLLDAFKKLTGMDPTQFFKDKDPVRAIGAAAGNSNMLSPEGVNKLAALIPGEKGKSLNEGIGVAGGGGGGGKRGGGGGDEGMGDLAAMMKALNAPADENGDAKSPFERMEFAMKGRDPAALADDPTISIFDRITYRYQVVSKRGILNIGGRPEGAIQ